MLVYLFFSAAHGLNISLRQPRPVWRIVAPNLSTQNASANIQLSLLTKDAGIPIRHYTNFHQIADDEVGGLVAKLAHEDDFAEASRDAPRQKGETPSVTGRGNAY